MTDTYTGWDGKSYPWPPPEGWYEASDGRWWAPGTGPNPPPIGAEPAATPPPSAMPSGAVDDVGRTAQLPTYGGAQAPGDVPGQGALQAGLTAPSHAARATTAPPTAFGGGPPPHGPGGTTAEWDQPPTEQPAERSGFARFLLVILGAIVALGVAGGAYFLLRDDGGDGSDTAATDDTAADGTDPTDTSADDGSTDDGLGSDTTQGTETTDPAAESSTTEAETTTSDSTTTTADITAQVQQFRSILADNGLTSDGLSDDDISTFSTTFCIFAVASEGPTEYERFRSERVAEAESDLTNEELSTVIDAAVVVFCPDEAERLGISL